MKTTIEVALSVLVSVLQQTPNAAYAAHLLEGGLPITRPEDIANRKVKMVIRKAGTTDSITVDAVGKYKSYDPWRDQVNYDKVYEDKVDATYTSLEAWNNLAIDLDSQWAILQAKLNQAEYPSVLT